MKSESYMSLQSRLNTIQERIQHLARTASREPETVQLIAVSKTKPIETIKEAFSLGQRHFGENKVQELREKYEHLPDANWHMIGTLQRNKVKYIASFIYLIHSVDTEKLLREINKQALKHDRVIDVLLQINISNEENKSGMEETEAREILENIDQYPQVRIRGLMGMAAFTDDKEVVRSQFNRLKEASEGLKSIQHDRIIMKELSMGMSGDYEIAIEEGATMIRVGSAIFGARNYSAQSN